MKKIIISLSGGIDSTVTLAHALDMDYEVKTVSFYYGSKHNEIENEAAKNISMYYGTPHSLIDLSDIMKNFESALLISSDEPIPEGHYQDNNMRKTVVPARNIIFCSILSGLAWSIEAKEVWIGIHAGDHFIYPDCRPEFYEAMKEAIKRGTDKKVDLIAPFLYRNKIDIVKRGLDLKAPFQLTRTCYTENPKACGKCGSCVERLEAFALNGISDFIEYEE